MFNKEIYIKRREVLKKSVKSGIVLLLGNGEAAMNYAGNDYIFRQDSSFIYYVGLDTPDLAYILDIEQNKEYLLGDELTIDDVIWMGNLPSLKERAAEVGIDNVRPFTELTTIIGNGLKSNRIIHYLNPHRYRNQLILSEIFGEKAYAIISGFSLELTQAIIRMRLIKSTEELAELEDAGKTGYAMHIVAMKMCRQGVSEREIAGTIEGLAISVGNRVSFPTILSMNGQTLHNHNHSGILKPRRLMLCDAGAENLNYYASDFTRTTAVDGEYNERQKNIHNIVLHALNDSIAMAKPGITYKSVHRNAYRIIFEGLRDLGLVKGDTEAALEAGVPALFMPHGLGHAMGLDVHDMENLGETLVGYDEETKRDTLFGYRSLRFGKRLEPGHVLTVEPGIYFIPQLIEKWKAEKINADFIRFEKLKDFYDFGGIRLEDDIVITSQGCRPVYEKRLPVTVEEIAEEVQS
ncbi:MAG: aminopeptidase P N-terminal domain-containing protein [Dysgonamonadaceae bacterium]|jgi:Xaa-Pro aminopeptidase|nr:aminopeptidase P N-terminal domain-containing protein [Dysgonamonadaceae bacterium]